MQSSVSGATNTITITMNNGFHFNDSGLGLLYGSNGGNYNMEVTIFQWTSMRVQNGSSSYDFGAMADIIKFTSNYTDSSMTIEINKNRDVVTLKRTRSGSNSSAYKYNIINGFIIAVPSYTTKP